MTAIEAMIYCLGFVSDVAVDGYFESCPVFDRYGEPHWIAWREDKGESATPELCGETHWPFSRRLEPYRLAKEPRSHEIN
jgi:hypothetical protein